MNVAVKDGDAGQTNNNKKSYDLSYPEGLK